MVAMQSILKELETNTSILLEIKKELRKGLGKFGMDSA